jgi:HSP20 family molecular chaperone IbpA
MLWLLLAGVSREDVDITFSSGVITISGTRSIASARLQTVVERQLWRQQESSEEAQTSAS